MNFGVKQSNSSQDYGDMLLDRLNQSLLKRKLYLTPFNCGESSIVTRSVTFEKQKTSQVVVDFVSKVCGKKAQITLLLDDVPFFKKEFDFLEDKKVYLILPTQKKVLTMKDASIFFTVEELEQIKEDELNGRVPEYLPPQVNNRDKVSMLRFVEELKRDMDLFDKETKEKNEVIVDNIMHRIRAENKAYRRTGKKISKFWNERREGKTRMPLTRKEKGEKSARKARKAASRRFYPHLAVIWNQKERS